MFQNKNVLTLIVLFFSFKTIAYDQKSFKSDLFSPLEFEKSKETLLWGSSLTLFLIATQEKTIRPTQDTISSSKPLGNLAQLGDISGQMVPNLLYMLYQYSWGNDIRRTQYMLKTSFFAGFTTFFLKRIVNQKRPNSSDRNSFPSGHTTTAFAFAGVVAKEHPEYQLSAYGLAALVAFSRINDNAHYLHDVVMGASIGLAYAQAFGREQQKKLSFNLIPFADGAFLSKKWFF